MTTDGNIEKLKKARDIIAKVYEEEAIDEISDDGNLSTLNAALLSINQAIRNIENKKK